MGGGREGEKWGASILGTAPQALSCWQPAQGRGVNSAPQAGGLGRRAGLRARLSPRFAGRVYRRIKKPLGRGFKFSPTSVKLVPQFHVVQQEYTVPAIYMGSAQCGGG